MRASCVLFTALVALAAYYVYIPLPGSVTDPWKLMMLDAVFRGTQQVSNLIHFLGLGHHMLVLNFIIVSFGHKRAWSTAQVKVTDTDFDGVEVRVFEGSTRPEEPLKRGIIYIHGGGWALASAKIKYYDELCIVMAEELNAVIVSIEYRLVPKVFFPSQVEDVVRSTNYFLQPEVLKKYSVDPSRVAVSGDSAGGNLAAALVQQCFQEPGTRNRKLVASGSTTGHRKAQPSRLLAQGPVSWRFLQKLKNLMMAGETKAFLLSLKHTACSSGWALHPWSSPGATFTRHPQATSLQPAVHPSVDTQGNICLDILKEHWFALL